MNDIKSKEYVISNDATDEEVKEIILNAREECQNTYTGKSDKKIR